MRIVALLLALLVVAGGLPVCRCADHGGAECRTIGAEPAAPAASGCCSSDAGGDAAPAAPSNAGCCCIVAPPADPTAAPPPGLAPPSTSLAKELAAPLYFVAPTPLALGGTAPVGDAASRGGPTARSAPGVPLYRLHAALLI